METDNRKMADKKINGKSEEDKFLEKIFGKTRLKTLEEFSSEKENFEEYKQYLDEQEMGVQFQRDLLFSELSKVIPLDYLYDGAGIILTNNKNKEYPETLILIINDVGEVANESEKLGMPMRVNYIDRQFIFIPKKEISGLSITQHLCANPDCRSCAKRRDLGEESLPYNVHIYNSVGFNTIELPALYAAANLVKIISEWQNEKAPIRKKRK